MKKVFGRLLILTCLLALAVSCGDTALLNPADSETHSVEVKSISEGGILAPDESLSFIISMPEDEENPSRLDINLYAADGSVYAQQSIENPKVGENLQVFFPNIQEGRYRIGFVLYGKNTVLTEKQLTFFYTVGEYVIRGIESFPPVIIPSSKVLLKAILNIPEGADPYIRWKQGQKILARGLLSEGLGHFYWSVPKEDGVYSLSVEIFPFAPLTGQDFSFVSTSSMATELYISSSQDVVEYDFTPKESYFSLFHLNGDLMDSGSGFSKSGVNDAQQIGSPEPAAHEDVLGFRILSGSGFRVPRLILPVEYGALKPFSVSFGLSFDTLTAGSRLLRSSSEEGSLEFEMSLNADLSPTGILKTATHDYLFPSGITPLEPNKRYILSLSMTPDSEKSSLDVRWFLDGLPYAAYQFTDVILTDIPAKGESTIGGDGGFSGILDEIGIYYRDAKGNPSVDPKLR
ncbi:MAG TPA: hypothetical protein VMX75_06825 [Spirochaetia bacterium]|nr:hypothetical protein [Spirochaetia bacterium]